MSNNVIRVFVRRQLRTATVGVATAIGLGGALPAAIAGPAGGSVVSGHGSITNPNAATTLINQQSNQLVLNWSSFNVAPSETVKFVQPSSTSVALNNILSQSPSQIFGHIDANGRVVLVNPNGILFGRTAQLNVGSLIASSLELTGFDATTGRFSFQSVSGHPGSIENRGTINAARGGSVALLGGTVLNNGLIVADYGTVDLGAGKIATLDFYGGGLLRMQVSGDIDSSSSGASAAVANSGEIQADGGQVFLSARATQNVFASAVNNTGVIRASRIDNVGGVIELAGPDGVVADSGTLDASGADASSGGGTITVAGESVSVLGTAKIDASGATGGGDVFIGGGLHGANSAIPNAASTSVDAGSTITADATGAGGGGTIAIWSDGATSAHGTLSASGAGAGGDGGLIETSGHVLDVGGIHVRAGAVAGNAGTWLLDPTDVTIEHGSGSSISGGTNNGASPVYDGDINTALGAGTDVTIDTSGTGGSGNITISNTVGIGPSTQNNSTLTLNAAAGISWNSSWSYTNSGQLTLYAANGAISAGATGQPIILGGTSPLLLQATNGIGSQTVPIETTGLTSLAAQNGTGGIYISNSGSGNVVISSRTNPLTSTINGLSVTGASDISLTNSAGTITESGGGIVSTSGTLTTSSVGGTTLEGANTVGSFNGTNSGTGVLNLTNTGALAITGISQTGTGSSLSVIAGGTITQSGVLNVSGTTTLTANSGTSDITLSNTGNSFAGNVAFTGKNVTLASTGALSGSGTAAGTLTETAGGAITQGGVLTVVGTTTLTANSGASDITLGQANVFGGNVAFTGNNVTLVTGAGDALQSSGTAGGNLTETAGGAISQGGALSVVGTSQLDAGSNPIVLANTGNALAGAISVTGGAVTLANTDDTTLGGGSTASGLTLDAGGAVTFGAATTDSTAIANGLTVQGLGGSGAAGGSVSQVGTLSVGGTSNINVGSNSITLSNPANDLAGPLTLTGGTVSIASSSAVTLTGNNSATSGDFNIASGGTVTLGSTNTDALTVAGTLAIDSGGSIIQQGGSGVQAASTQFDFTSVNGGDLVLKNASQMGSMGFQGTINALDLEQTSSAQIAPLSGRTFTSTILTSPSSLDIPAMNVPGPLEVIAGGTITQAGVLNVSGTTTLTANSGASDITLSNGGNSFAGNVAFTGNNVTLVTGAGNALQSSGTAGGNLTETAGGVISQGGVLNVGGTTTLAANGGASDITLGQANAFGGNVAFTGKNVTLGTGAGDALQSSGTAGGSLTETTGGAISQGGVLNVGGTTTLTANGGASDITLSDATNSFGGVAFTGRNVTLTNTGALNGSGTATGTLTETAGGAITQGGVLNVSGTTTLTAHGGASDITLGQANAFGGNVAFTGNSVTLVTGAGDALQSSGTAGGSLTETTGGAISQGGVLNVGGTTTLTANSGASDITLSDATNSFGAVAFTGRNVTLTNTGALNGSGTATGNLTETAGGAITQSGGLAVSGTTTLTANSGASDITLNGAANSFGGNVAFIGRNVLLTSAGALSGSGTAAGNLTETADGSISEGNAGIQLKGTPGANTAMFTVTGGRRDVNLGSAQNNFNAEGVTITSSGGGTVGNVMVADTNATFVPLTLPGTLTSLVLSDARAPIKLFGETLTGVGAGRNAAGGTTSLDVAAGGAITQTGALVVNGASSFNAGAGSDITLSNAGNSFAGNVAFTGKNVTLASTGALSGSGTAAGNLSETAGGAISQGGVLNVGGTTTLTANGGASDITLGQANAFAGNVAFTGNNITLGTGAGDALQSSGTAGGSLTETAGGTITQSGALVVSGASSFNAGVGNDVTLTNAGNSFAGNVAFTGKNVALANTGALSGSGTAAGTLTETAGGAITQGGVLNVGGTTALTANGGASDITLGQANAFGGNVAFTGNNVTLGTGAGDALQSSGTAGGSLTETAGGAISQGGVLKVTGTTALTANSGASDITLSNANNNFGAVAFNGRNVTLANTAALNGSGTATGNLAETAGGAITQNGALAVSGASSFNAGAGNDITLSNAGNSFADNVAFTGKNVTLASTGALSGSGTAAGTLTETSGGVIGQGGVLNVGSTTTLIANNGASDIRLGQANAFGGNVAFTGNNVTLGTGAGDALQSSGTAGGSLTETAGGAISQGGVLNVGGTTTLTANSGSSDITLGQANVFGGNVAFTGNDVTLVTGAGDSLQSSGTAGGNLTETAGSTVKFGQIIAGGAVTAVANSGDIDFGTAGMIDSAGAVSLTANAGSITGANALTSNAPTTNVTGASLTASAASGIGTDVNPLTVDVSGAVSAKTQGGFISLFSPKTTLTISDANAGSGSIELRATGTSSDVMLASLEAGGHVLLVAGNSILGTGSQATVTANNVEARYGIEGTGGEFGSADSNRQIGLVAASGTQVALTAWAPQGAPSPTSQLRQTASGVKLTQINFPAGEPLLQLALYTSPFGVTYSQIQTQVAASLSIVTSVLDPPEVHTAANDVSNAGHSVLYVDWSSYNPNVSLFGTLNPPVCLPGDQRDEDVSSASGCSAPPSQARLAPIPAPNRITMVLTRAGWMPMPLFDLPQ